MKNKRKRFAYSTLFSLLVLLLQPVSALDDKTLHFSISSVAGYLAETTLHRSLSSNKKRIVYGTILGSMPGLIKEIKDSNDPNNHFSADDMTANIAGAFIGSLLANRLNNHFMVSMQKHEDAVLVGFSYQP